MQLPIPIQLASVLVLTELYMCNFLQGTAVINQDVPDT